MAQKIYDLAVKTGEYTNGKGETKSRYANIGAIMQKDDGGKFLMINRHFNPAGVPFREGSDSILVSMFEPNDGNNSQQHQQQQRQSQHQQAKSNGYSPDDDIPF